jgi:PKD repeat protein
LGLNGQHPCPTSSFSISDSVVCALDTLCMQIGGNGTYMIFADSLTDLLGMGTAPGEFCTLIPPDAGSEYHTIIVIITSEDGSCVDTIRKVIYVKPACACGAGIDACPAMEAKFTYTIYPGYVVLRDASEGDGTFIQWFAGGETFVTGMGDSMVYTFPNTGNFEICMTMHNLVYDNDICCVDDTCITIFGGVDTCSILNLQADFNYSSLEEDPYTYNFTPTGTVSPAPDVVIWSFGDGTSVYNTNTSAVSHTFDSELADSMGIESAFEVCVNQIWFLPGNYCCIDSQCYNLYVGPLSSSMKVFPNPTTGRTVFSFKVAQPGLVELSLQDELGRVLDVLIGSEYYTEGYHAREFDLSNLANAVYTYRFKSQDGVVPGKFIKQ